MAIRRTVVQLWRVNSFLKSWPSLILGFKKSNFNFRYGSEGQFMRHRTKSYRDRSNRSWDMAIFRCFQNCGLPPSWTCCCLCLYCYKVSNQNLQKKSSCWRR